MSAADRIAVAEQPFPISIASAAYGIADNPCRNFAVDFLQMQQTPSRLHPTGATVTQPGGDNPPRSPLSRRTVLSRRALLTGAAVAFLAGRVRPLWGEQ